MYRITLRSPSFLIGVSSKSSYRFQLFLRELKKCLKLGSFEVVSFQNSLALKNVDHEKYANNTQK